MEPKSGDTPSLWWHHLIWFLRAAKTTNIYGMLWNKARAFPKYCFTNICNWIHGGEFIRFVSVELNVILLAISSYKCPCLAYLSYTIKQSKFFWTVYYLLNDVFIFGQYQTNTQCNKKLKQLLKKLKTINCFHMNECLRRAIGGTGAGEREEVLMS